MKKEIGQMKFIATEEKARWMPREAQEGMPEVCDLELTGEKAQTIRGFGGCFNELGQIALEKLDEGKRNEVLDALFGSEGCGFTVCRVPIGASDYAAKWYSCDETEEDYELRDFSIERDKKYLLPYIHDAQKRRPELTVFASPWSPPTWMKFPAAYNHGTIRWEEPVLRAYAKYFVKFVGAYAEEGVTVDQIFMQNEPIADQKYPSCVWSGEQMRDFLRDYLAPEFEKSGCPAEIWLGTLNCPYDNYGGQEFDWTNYHRYAETVLLDDAARKVISGVGYQWGGKNAIAQTHESFPELRLMQTENECGNGENSWKYMEYVFDLMHHYFKNGVEAYTYWNMVLEDGGCSTWGWHQNSMITVNAAEGTYALEPEYYLMRHFAGFVQRGARLLKLRGRFAANAMAFENPDGSVVLVVHNGQNDPFTLRCGLGEGFTATLAPHSINTFVL